LIAMAHNYYQLGPADRRRLLAEAGFERDEHGIWSHRDGRALGDGVAAALTDGALLRYLGVAPKAPGPGPGRRKKTRSQ
jgi:hypothetical protein